MKAIPGRLFILGFALVIACVAALGFRSLRQAQDRRFAISLRAEPAAQAPDELPLGRSLVVRIEKRTAGRSPQPAWALLLDGSGSPLAELQPLQPRQLDNGKTVEETTFAPLQTAPAGRIVAAVVVRMPREQEATMRATITGVLSAVRERHGQLREAFGNLLPTIRRLGGHAELVQGQVPTTPPPKQ